MPSRRDFLRFSGLVALALAASRRRGRAQPRAQTTEGSAPQRVDQPAADRAGKITLFLCGDVMTGRGIDQILSVPSDPRLHERWVESAVDYVKLAERASGSIPRSVEPTYIWGEALAEVERCRPDLRIINLETSVTTSSDWQLKGINYRMHPDNVACLTAAGIDCCVLANNHVLDW
ncbi:MAG: CapA family protein, partial [bacterium]|nr:CapA family protein [bacterium]